MSTVAMKSSSPSTSSDPALLPEPHAADATQDAVDRALEGAQRLVAELRSARLAALVRHARDSGP